jgi:ribosomal protein S18 acetylase RimI-like enzyme
VGTRKKFGGLYVVEAIVRKVRPSDREDVLEISSRVWNGHDYLPLVFDEWLGNPKCHTYGLEVDGRIVAVANLRLIDGNKTGWMEGLRVHSDHRRRGYADMLTRRLVQLGEELRVQRLRYTTGSNTKASVKLAKKAGFKKLFKLSVFWHEGLDSRARSKFPRGVMTEVTPRDAYEISRICPSLVAGDVLVYDWKAVDATPRGFKEVAKDHVFYASKNRGELPAFSFGHSRPESDFARWSFTVYALDQNSFLKHFRIHVNAALNAGLAATVCTCPTTFEKMLKEGERVPKCDWKMQLVLFEKENLRHVGS